MANDNRTSAQKMAPSNPQSGSAYNPDLGTLPEYAAFQAEQRASDAKIAANRAYSRRPGGENDITKAGAGLPVQYKGLPPTSGNNVKARKGK